MRAVLAFHPAAAKHANNDGKMALHLLTDELLLTRNKYGPTTKSHYLVRLRGAMLRGIPCVCKANPRALSIPQQLPAYSVKCPHCKATLRIPTTGRAAHPQMASGSGQSVVD